MANTKEFLDRDGISYLWNYISTLLGSKANQSDINVINDRLDDLDFDEIELYGGSASDVIEEAND